MIQSSEAVETQQSQEQPTGDWSGGTSPVGAPNAKLGMWLFLGSDALTFTGLLVGYGVSRLGSTTWPVPEEVFGGLELVAAMTFILICSSATMAVSVTAAKRSERRRATLFLLLTILGGLIFLGAQAYEWSHFIHEGARLFTNPWGDPLFSASFFVITGFHGFHVFSGVVYLAWTAVRIFQGHYSGTGIEVAGLYWHFVDVVWVFVFTMFYLL